MPLIILALSMYFFILPETVEVGLVGRNDVLAATVFGDKFTDAI